MSLPTWIYSSPSPITLAFYSLLAYYGTRRVQSKGMREWLALFSECAFLIGLVILPYDVAWQILQWLKWGYLYPSESIMVLGILIRDSMLYALCLLSSWKLATRTNQIHLKISLFVFIPIIVLVGKFAFTPTPTWTDWTYGIRFELNSPWLLALLSGLVDKVALGLIYLGLWKGGSHSWL